MHLFPSACAVLALFVKEAGLSTDAEKSMTHELRLQTLLIDRQLAGGLWQCTTAVMQLQGTLDVSRQRLDRAGLPN